MQHLSVPIAGEREEEISIHPTLKYGIRRVGQLESSIGDGHRESTEIPKNGFNYFNLRNSINWACLLNCLQCPAPSTAVATGSGGGGGRKKR